MSPPFTPRSNFSIEKREEIIHLETSSSSPPPPCYKIFQELQNRIAFLNLGKDWTVSNHESYSSVISSSGDHMLPQFEIYVEPSLKFTLRVFGWLLNDLNELCSNYERSFKNITLSDLVKVLNGYILCPGSKLPDEKSALYVLKHVIPYKFSFPQYLKSPSAKHFSQLSFIVQIIVMF